MKKLIISTVLLTAISVSQATDVLKDDVGGALQGQAQAQVSVQYMASGFDRAVLAEKAPIGTMAQYVELNENTKPNSQTQTNSTFNKAPSSMGY